MLTEALEMKYCNFSHDFKGNILRVCWTYFSVSA